MLRGKGVDVDGYARPRGNGNGRGSGARSLALQNTRRAETVSRQSIGLFVPGFTLVEIGATLLDVAAHHVNPAVFRIAITPAQLV